MHRDYVFRKATKRTLAGFVDAIGSFWRPAPGRPGPTDSARLLLVRLDHLGDVLCTLPLIQEVHRLRPQMKLTVLTSSAGATLLRDTPGIEEVLIFDAPWFSRGPHSSLGGIGSLRALAQRLRAKKFDAAFELRGDARHHLLLAWAGIPFRAGYGSTGGGFLLHQELPWVRSSHAVDSNLAFLRMLDAVAGPEAKPQLSWKARSEEVSFLKNHIPGQRFLVIHPDAGTPAKRWPWERFLSLINQTVSAGFRAVLVGLDTSLHQQIRSTQKPDGVIDLFGQTSLPELITLIQASSGVLSNDSGPAHLAAALNKPTFVLWSGTSDPALWKPVGRDVTCVQAHVPCEYCAYEICPLPEQICLSHLTVESVMPAFLPFLARCAENRTVLAGDPSA